MLGVVRETWAHWLPVTEVDYRDLHRSEEGKIRITTSATDESLVKYGIKVSTDTQFTEELQLHTPIHTHVATEL